MASQDPWDVAVIGAGPAGLAAARAAAGAGARTVVLERAAHPRYKTCGGGLIGASLTAAGDGVRIPVRDEISSCTFTLRGKRERTRVHRTPMLAMVLRDEFDDELRRAAAKAGAQLREHCLVRGLSQEPDRARVHLASGDDGTARVVVGA